MRNPLVLRHTVRTIVSLQSTYYYINAISQWNKINQGNWKSISIPFNLSIYVFPIKFLNPDTIHNFIPTPKHSIQYVLIDFKTILSNTWISTSSTHKRSDFNFLRFSFSYKIIHNYVIYNKKIQININYSHIRKRSLEKKIKIFKHQNQIFKLENYFLIVSKK